MAFFSFDHCRSQMILEMLHVLEDIYENKLGGSHIFKYCDALQEGVRPKKYQPLLSRNKCSQFRHFWFYSSHIFRFKWIFPFFLYILLIHSIGSLENRIEHYAKKRRIDIINHDEAAQRKQDIAAQNEQVEQMSTDEWRPSFKFVNFNISTASKWK